MTIRSVRMTVSDYRNLSMHLGHAANVMRQLAYPMTWPDWLTQQRREEIAGHFGRYQIEIDEAINAGLLPPPPTPSAGETTR